MPEFNSGIDYLQRIGGIIQSGHMAAGSRDGAGLFIVCQQLITESSPRMNKEELGAYETAEEKLRNLSINKPYSKDLLKHTNTLFRSLNQTLHKKGLIMRDSEEGSNV